MTKRARRTHSPAFKAKVAQAAIKGERTLSELATYIPMARGFVYLAAVVDRFSRRVLACRLSITLETGFCLEAVGEALARHGKPEIFNTDSKYAPASCSCSA